MDGPTSSPRNNDDRAADFVRLLGEHDARMHAYILSLVPNWADAHEIAQDVRLRLWEQFDQFDPKTDFGAWACTVAYYKVLAFRKASTREHARLSAAFVESLAKQRTPQKEAADGRHQALLGCLQTLRAPQRDLLMRYYSGEQSLKEIADDEGQTFAALRQRVVRLRKALARCIERRLPAEGRS